MGEDTVQLICNKCRRDEIVFLGEVVAATYARIQCPVCEFVNFVRLPLEVLNLIVTAQGSSVIHLRDMRIVNFALDIEMLSCHQSYWDRFLKMSLRGDEAE